MVEAVVLHQHVVQLVPLEALQVGKVPVVRIVTTPTLIGSLYPLRTTR